LCCFAADVKASVKEQELELLRQFDISADYGPCLGEACSHIIIIIVFIAVLLLGYSCICCLAFVILCDADVLTGKAAAFEFFIHF